jgi:hypothetical protein
VDVLVNGALLHVTDGDEIAQTATYMDGFLLAVVVRRRPAFRASLYRVYPRTFEVRSDVPEFWETFGINDAICDSPEVGFRLIRERVEALSDQDPTHYVFRKSPLTSWRNA